MSFVLEMKIQVRFLAPIECTSDERLGGDPSLTLRVTKIFRVTKMFRRTTTFRMSKMLRVKDIVKSSVHHIDNQAK